MNRSLRLLVVASLCLAAHAASAQTQRSGGSGAASAQLVQQLQQLGSERTALQAENDRLKKELADAKKQQDTLKSGQQALDRKIKASEATALTSSRQRETTEAELAKTKERMQELITKFRETVQTLKEVEAGRATATQTLATRERELKSCIDRNVALYQLNDEVLNRFEHEGAWPRLARAEPFTQLKRNQNENLIDDYRARAADQKLPAAPPAAVAPAAAGVSRP